MLQQYFSAHWTKDCGQGNLWACRTCWFLVLTLGYWARLCKGEAWESAFIICFCPTPKTRGASLVAQMVKNLPVMQETHVRSLGWEDPPEKGMVPLFLSGEFHGQRNLASYSPWGFKELNTTEQLALFQKRKKKKIICFPGNYMPRDYKSQSSSESSLFLFMCHFCLNTLALS